MVPMHFDSLDGIRFSVEEGRPRICGEEGEEYEILTPTIGHPYCKKAEDAFTVAQETGAWKERLEEVPVFMHLRRREDLSYRRTHFRASLAVKAIGVQSAIVQAPEVLKGFICTPPQESSASGIVVRPFFSRNIGATLVNPDGSVQWDRAYLEAHPFVLPLWVDGWKFVNDGTPLSSMAIASDVVLTLNERMKSFDQTGLRLGTFDGGAFSLEVSDGVASFSAARVFVVGEAEVVWLAFPDVEIPGNRLGLSLKGTQLRPQLYQRMVEGKISAHDSGFHFAPFSPLGPQLPHLWALKR
jgi:hypothetical protein